MPTLCRPLLLAVLAAAPALAETPSSTQAQADLAQMRSLAAGMEDPEGTWRQLERLNRETGTDLVTRLRDLLGDRSGGSGAFAYRDAALIEAATRRAMILSNLLSADLDADGTVTRDEIARVLAIGRSNGQLGDLFLRFDTDTDDRVTPDELARGVASAVREASSGREDRAQRIGRLVDFDADGLVTEDELVRAVRALAAQSAPIEFGTPAAEPVAAAPVAAPCKVTPPGSQAELHVVTGYEGHALSSVSIGGQDQVTQIVDLVIEPGDRPLYLVVASFELVIWRITGAVDRVERIVVQSGATASDLRSGGVIGLPAERISFVASGACFTAGWERPAAVAASAALALHLGRNADAAFADYTLASVAVPSGTASKEDPVAKPPRTDDPQSELQRQLLRFHPGGVVEIDPQTVVSPHPVEPYVVLPSQAGLAQLLQQGLITMQGDSFLILRPIPRFPAGLYGAHSVNFVLGPGVTMPPGNPGHSRVLDGSGACLTEVCR